MKKIFTLCLLCCSLFSFSQSTTLVISQVYGAGGNSGATYNADYVELKNISTAAINLSGYSIQYASATATTNWTGVYALPSVSVPAGGYYLIQMSTASAIFGIALPTPDAVASPAINMAAAAGRVALVNGTTALSACPSSASYLDLVGFGTSTCFQGTGTAPAPGAALADFRKNNGCTSTANNAADFETALPAPRNSATGSISCSGPAPVLTVTPLAAFTNTCLNTASAPNLFTITGSNLSASTINVGPLSGYNFSTTSAGTYTTSLSLTQAGGSYSQDIYVEFTPVAPQAYTGNIPVNGGGTSVNVAASGTGINTTATVNSGAAGSILQGSATVAGEITTDGCSAVTAYGIEYSTTMGFVNGNGISVASTNISGGNFSSDITGLVPTTTYYYHAYATNNGGTAYGAEMSFTTSVPTTPYITASQLATFGNNCINTTAGPNDFTINAAALTTENINIASLEGYSFSTTANGTYTSSLSIAQPGGSFTQTIFVKLTAAAVQSYDGNIVISGGGAPSINVTASGAGVNTMASVSTGTSSAVTQTSATLEGAITADGCSAVTSYGIEYSTVNGFANGSGTTVTSTNLNAGTFSSAIPGLIVNTTYYYHAFAINGGGTAYGTQQSFTTVGAIFTITPLTGFGSVCVNTSAAPGSFTISSDATSPANINIAALAGYSYSTTSNGTYSSSLTLAQPGGTYSQTIFVKFTPVAVQTYNGNINISGGGATNSYTVAVSGTGINNGATLTTGDATNVLKNTATVSGTITSVGCAATTAYGVEYSSVKNFANGTGMKVYSNNISNNNFSVGLNGLVQNTKYYYKAFAASSLGTAYGAVDSVSTYSIGNVLVIYSIPVLRGGALNFSLGNLSPARYQVYLVNMVGQVVYHQEMIIQVSFIDGKIIVPANLPAGQYVLQIKTTSGYSISKRFLLL